MNKPDLTRRRAAASAASLLLGGLAFPGCVTHPGSGPVERFGLGVASGQPRPDGMVLWTRLLGDDLPERVPVQWEVADDEAFREVRQRGEFTAQREWAHSVHAEPRGLAPGRWYWYRFTALGQRSAVGRTRTAPAVDAAGATLRFAIASCQRYDVAHYAAWRHLAAQPLDAVIFLGDYIYESASAHGALRPHTPGVPHTLAAYRDRYAQYKSDPLLQAAHAACPWWLVWDDHEVENDYANDRGTVLTPNFLQRRAAAYQAYWEHMPFPMASRPHDASMRIYDRFRWGRLATLHLLDDRQYRDWQVCPKPGHGGSNTVSRAECPAIDDPRRTLLGFEQERWLADGLDRERPWNLIAQQSLIARFSWRDPAVDPTYWTDAWDGYPAARSRLIEAIAQRQLPGAVTLGGDVHSHYVTELKRDFNDPRSAIVASEFVGTSITSRSIAQSRVDTARAYNPHVLLGRSDRRGAIVFALDERRLQAELLDVDDDQRRDSRVSTLARFVVEAGRPGPQAA